MPHRIPVVGKLAVGGTSIVVLIHAPFVGSARNPVVAGARRVINAPYASLRQNDALNKMREVNSRWRSYQIKTERRN